MPNDAVLLIRLSCSATAIVLWPSSSIFIHTFKKFENYQMRSSAPASARNHHPTSRKVKKQEKEWLGVSFKPENFIPGVIIGFIVGLLFDLAKPTKSPGGRKFGGSAIGRNSPSRLVSSNSDEDLKMVLVVRQDLKMGTGKVASQCAHAATGLYSELMESHRSLLRQWEFCGQAKIVVACKNQQEMNKLKDTAESIGLPTFSVADAGRTQVSAGSKTVLAIGPGFYLILSFIFNFWSFNEKMIYSQATISILMRLFSYCNNGWECASKYA